MLGIGLAILSALCWATLDAQRKVLTQQVPPMASVAVLLLGTGILFSMALPWTLPTTPLASEFWWAILASVVLNLMANVLFFMAVQKSPLSLTIPYLSFTPVFMLASGGIVLGEYPGWLGIVGVLAVLVGGILINPGEEGRFAPLLALKNEPGSYYMLAVALLWSITGPVEKIALQHAHPVVLGAFINLSVGLAAMILVLLRSPQALKKVLPSWKLAALASGTQALGIVTQLFAFSFLFVAYVDTIKRSGALFAVLIGYFYFHERPLRPRLLGASVMFAGVCLIIWSQALGM